VRVLSGISSAKGPLSGPCDPEGSKGEDQGRFDHISLEGQTRHLHANMDPPRAEGNFCYDSNHPMKPDIVEWYNCHMGYVDNSGHMANSYLMCQRTFKWTMKLFFHFLGLTVLNSWILLSSCGAKYEYTHRDFRLLLVRNLIEEAGKSKIAPPPDWLEDQVRPQQMFCDSRVTITNTGQRNLQQTFAAMGVLPAAKESVQFICVPDVTRGCAWFLVLRNITQK